jgi:RecQ mediated genome instability protein
MRELLLMNVPVLRGVLQLRPTNTTLLGGRIAELDDGYFPERWKAEMEATITELRRAQNGV